LRVLDVRFNEIRQDEKDRIREEKEKKSELNMLQLFL
jgi:hypothetical protein